MKKIVTLFVAAICLSANAAGTFSASMNKFVQETTVAETRSITVYLVKQVGGGVWSKSSISATYDSERNVIKVGKFEYTIHENRAYGQEKDGRAEFKYQAGNYFFNL